MKPSKPPKHPRPNVHDCAKGGMHAAFALLIVKTMPGGFIA